MGVNEIDSSTINMDKFSEDNIIVVCHGEITDEGMFNLKEPYKLKKDEIKYNYIYFLWRIEGRDVNQYIFPVKGSDKYMKVIDDIDIQ